MNGGRQPQSVDVDYDIDGSPLNRVSLPLEECPTAFMDVDSEVSNTYRYLDKKSRESLENPSQKADVVNPQNID